MTQLLPRTQAERAPAVRPASAARTKAADAARCRLVMQLAAHRFEVPRATLLGRGRGSRRASVARQVAIYLAHVALSVPLDSAARQFKRDRSTVAFACRQVEDRRDEPAFDVAVADLELALKVLLELAAEAA